MRRRQLKDYLDKWIQIDFQTGMITQEELDDLIAYLLTQ